MTLTIELTPEQEARLQAAAHREGVAPEEYARRLIAQNGLGRSGGEGGKLAMIDEYEGISYIAGTRIKVSTIAEETAEGSSPEEIHAVRHPHLSLAQIHAALFYYYTHKEQIDAEIVQDRREVEELRAQAQRHATREELEARRQHLKQSA